MLRVIQYGLLAVLLTAPLPAWGQASGEPSAAITEAQHDAFARQLDLSRFRTLAVFEGGRAKIVDTLAREQLERIYGKPRWKDLSRTDGPRYDPVFTYLDLLLNRSYYLHKPMIYVDVLGVRRQLVEGLPADEQDVWLRRGRLTPAMLLGDPRAMQTLGTLSSDAIMQKAVGQVHLAMMSFQNHGGELLMISPAAGSEQWSHLMSLADPSPTPREAKGMEAQAVRALDSLRQAWAKADAAGANVALNTLAGLLPQIHPESYPPTWKRQAERLYNATHKFTIGYLAYFVGALALLIAVSVQRKWLIGTGVGFLLLGLLVHTAGIGVRAALSGRWPIHNQYESYIAMTWFAVLVGTALMLMRRQWMFGAAAAALGACALLLANTVEIPSREVGQVAGILATSRILYVHVNVVAFSYGLIALGFFASLYYLLVYYFQTEPAKAEAVRESDEAQTDPDGSGGTQTLVAQAAATQTAGASRHVLLGDLDKAQMVVLQLAFWLLGVGILLGAYWADHAWGRWWGWDPKETWALITWIVYLIVIHLRFAVKRRGLVTAWLSVVGFGVMLWTYWGVNLLLAGLHSYA